jgi:DNA repair protein RadC
MNHLIREVAVRYKGRKRLGPGVTDPQHVAKFVRVLLQGDAREHFIALHLDGRHRIVSYQDVSVGTATAALVHPREVFQAAVLVGACAVIVAHNHPSGDARPSSQDKEIAQRLSAAGKLLGIPVLDAVVIGDGHHYSARESDPYWLKGENNYAEPRNTAP